MPHRFDCFDPSLRRYASSSACKSASRTIIPFSTSTTALTMSPKRLLARLANSAKEMGTVTSFIDLLYHEKQAMNLQKTKLVALLELRKPVGDFMNSVFEIAGDVDDVLDGSFLGIGQ